MREILRAESTGGNLLTMHRGPKAMEDQNFEYGKSINDQAINASNAIFKALLTVHSGAVIALLAFTSGLAGKTTLQTERIASLTDPILFFGWGVVTTIGAMILAYFTHYMTVAFQFAEVHSAQEKRAGMLKTVFHVAAAVAAFASLGLFIGGMYAVRTSIGTILHPHQPRIEASAEGTSVGKPRQEAPAQ
jgi:hypothetical protein